MKLSKKARARRRVQRDLDAEARLAVFERDGGRCVGPPILGKERCGNAYGVQWAHVLSRRYKNTRHLPENAMTLCAGCHLKWHHDPLQSGVWFRETFPDRYKLIMEIHNGRS